MTMTESTKTPPSPRRRFALWQGAAALSTLALVPLATGAMATVDASTQEEISRFMDVFLEVKSNYVEPVSDDKLIEGAINGMLASLDPHSGYLDARDYSNLRTQTDGEYGGLGLSVTKHILDLHGAEISIQNRKEGGVRAVLRFQRSGEPERAEPA